MLEIELDGHKYGRAIATRGAIVVTGEVEEERWRPAKAPTQLPTTTNKELNNATSTTLNTNATNMCLVYKHKATGL
jgi:hypothetical protein